MTVVEFLSILGIAIGLSADCFAVAVSSSIAKRDHSWGDVLRVALSFGLFQTIMPVIGWLAGRTVVDLIGAFDHWVAFGLLAFVGGKMLWESFERGDRSVERADSTRGFQLVVLSIATSIDALAVGLSFALLQVNMLVATLAIGAVAFLVTVSGFLLGQKAGKLLGKRAELVGGIILIAIGLRILLSHLLQG